MQPCGDYPRAPHIVLLPSSGMGHLTPFTRLAAMLCRRNCEVSFIATLPMVSAAETRHIADFYASFPSIRPSEFHLPPLDPSEFNSADAFLLRFESISRSAHLLSGLLADLPSPISAVVVDISVASTYIPVIVGKGTPCYVYSPSSAGMIALCAYFPTYMSTKTIAGVGDVDIPGMGRVPRSSLPAPLRDPNHLFTSQFIENGKALTKADGIFLNSFQALEPSLLAALNGGKVVPDLPPVIAIGPLLPLSTEGGSLAYLSWLDEQPDRSVLYVNFGSRTGTSPEQLKEIGRGLEMSGCRFLWVVRSKVVDREDEGVGAEELLGGGYLERVKDRGLVVKGWVEQEEILRHRAVGGFLSHCGWNSVAEAALHGVRMLGWAWIGDQRVIAPLIEESGLGIWVERWKWEAEAETEILKGEEGKFELVSGDEICERVRELMADEGLQASAARLMEKAAAAVGVGGSSCEALTHFIDKLKV